MAEQAAPFIPSSPEETGLPPAFWRVFGTRSFFKLWVAQVVSSLGDWIGIIAILAIAARISGGSGAAVSLVMVARVVPGFFLATVGGVIVDRFDRRRVMVACDIGRAGLLALLPFVDSLLGLVLVSFALEILSLLWGPAKDASIPNLVDTKQLTSANSLGLFAAFGTFPLASLAFALLAYAAAGLSSFGAFSSLNVDREFLALWVDGLTFLVSAMIIWRLPIPRAYDRKGERADWTATLRDISEGVRFIRHNRLVRGVIIGIGVGLIGGGAMIPLGPVFADQVLGGGSAAFGLLMTTLGFGAAIGVVSLLIFQKRLSRETVFQFAVMATGVSLVAAASVSSTAIAVLLVGLVGAFAGSSYVTGFTVLQENVRDELRGRTFAALYTVIRMCLLISLTISPLWADGWDRVSSALFTNQAIEIGGYTYALPGVRFALWGGGLITFFAGFVSWRAVRRARRRNEDRVAAAAVSQAED
ncbi:MAG: MFS transporter [Actinomycetota bacterium]|jgi:dTMP kinase|nr:MFS transporter [Actinomycetota bacterium]